MTLDKIKVQPQKNWDYLEFFDPPPFWEPLVQNEIFWVIVKNLVSFLGDFRVI